MSSFKTDTENICFLNLCPLRVLFLVDLGNSGSVDEVMMLFAEAKIFIYIPACIFPLGRLIQRDLTLKLVPWKELVTLASVSFHNNHCHKG